MAELFLIFCLVLIWVVALAAFGPIAVPVLIAGTLAGLTIVTDA